MRKNDPAWIAADLLSQAEHDPTSQSILITDDAAFAAMVEDQVDVQCAALATGKTAPRKLGCQWRADRGRRRWKMPSRSPIAWPRNMSNWRSMILTH